MPPVIVEALAWVVHIFRCVHGCVDSPFVVEDPAFVVAVSSGSAVVEAPTQPPVMGDRPLCVSPCDSFIRPGVGGGGSFTLYTVLPPAFRCCSTALFWRIAGVRPWRYDSVTRDFCMTIILSL